MKRTFRLFTAFLAAALLLAACAQSPASTAESAATSVAAATRIPTPDGPPMECTMYSLLPDPTDPANINLPPVSADDWSRGPENADMTIVLYSDFQCPACAQAAPNLQLFEALYPDRVRVIYRNYPLSQHDKALLAAEAAEAAGLQGKFWEMHDFLFEESHWSAWTALSVDEFPAWIQGQVAAMGLNADQFAKDMSSDAVKQAVEADVTAGDTIGLHQTPTLFVYLGDQLIFTHDEPAPYDADTLELILKLYDLHDKQYTACPPVIIDQAKTYIATIQTEIGDIKIELFADKAPLAVNSFVFLAKMGYYDNTTFHRVIAGALAQAGDPSGTGMGWPGYEFANEISDDLKFDQAGRVGMANAGADTNGSQFFITFKDFATLDGSYTVFGQVTEGLDVAEKLTPRDSSDTTTPLQDGTIIKTITIEEQ